MTEMKPTPTDTAIGTIVGIMEDLTHLQERLAGILAELVSMQISASGNPVVADPFVFVPADYKQHTQREASEIPVEFKPVSPDTSELKRGLMGGIHGPMSEGPTDLKRELEMDGGGFTRPEWNQQPYFKTDNTPFQTMAKHEAPMYGRLQPVPQGEGWTQPENPLRGAADVPYVPPVTSRYAKVAKRDAAVLNDLALGIYTRAEIAKMHDTDERLVRKIVQRARERGDTRDFSRRTQSPPVVPSLETSHTQRKDGSDSLDGGVVGQDLTTSDPGSPQNGSEQESADPVTLQPQARNEPGHGGDALAADAGGGEVAAEAPPAREILDDEDAFKHVPKTTYLRFNVGGLKVGEEGRKVEVIVREDDDDTPMVPRFLPALPKEPVKEPAKPAPEPVDPERFLIKGLDPKVFTYREGSQIGIDVHFGRILGPKGAVQVGKRMCRVINHMGDGLIYDIQTLARVGGFGQPREVQVALLNNKLQLQAAGLTLHGLGKEMFRLAPSEA